MADLVGKPLDVSPEQLDQAATVTPVDVMVARLVWLQFAPTELSDLLDATNVKMAQYPGISVGGL